MDETCLYNIMTHKPRYLVLLVGIVETHLVFLKRHEQVYCIWNASCRYDSCNRVFRSTTPYATCRYSFLLHVLACMHLG